MATTGTLYLVATPIGNLEDVSLRALRILREVDLIASESPATTLKLLRAYDIRAPITSYNDYSGERRTRDVMEKVESGAVALVSAAGMPGLSDPGYRLVVRAIEQGFEVEPIPGASAITAAVAASGLPCNTFLFLGFLSRQPARRRRSLEEISGVTHTLVLFESPRRVLDTVAEAEEILGDRRVAVARELTKVHEEWLRGSLSQVRIQLAGREPRGEYTLVIEGAPRRATGTRKTQR